MSILRWPTDVMKERVLAIRGEERFEEAEVTVDYPMRAIGYWWAYCAIMDELREECPPLTVVDAGCGPGIVRRFVGGDTQEMKWIGLDWRADEEQLVERGYDQVHVCDLDETLPLDDASADVVTFMHVIEHLPRMSFTLSELARILRPGGVLVAGSPSSPRSIAWMRDLKYRHSLRAGTRKEGHHINALSPGLWRELLDDAGLRVEKLSGTHLLRWSKSPLENYAWWLRANLLWGALFPSLSLEVYVVAHKC